MFFFNLYILKNDEKCCKVLKNALISYEVLIEEDSWKGY